MRIALMPSAYAPAVGGVEQLTHHLAGRLLSEGHAVEVWVNRHPHDLPQREHVEGIEVRRFALAMPRADLRDAPRFATRAGRAIRDLRQAVSEFQPDVVHVQCFSVNGAYASALSWFGRTPLAISLQG